MAVNSIQLGQVWRSEADGQDYLVTKVYNEVFTQYAMLRPAGISAPSAPTTRIKVSKDPREPLYLVTPSRRKAPSSSVQERGRAQPVADLLKTDLGNFPLH